MLALRVLLAFTLCATIPAFADETVGMAQQDADSEVAGPTQDSNVESEEGNTSLSLDSLSSFFTGENATAQLKFLSQKRTEILQKQAKLSEKIRNVKAEMQAQEAESLKGSRFEEFADKIDAISALIESANDDIYSINKKKILEAEGSPLISDYQAKIVQLNKLKELHENEQERLQNRLNEATSTVQSVGRMMNDSTSELKTLQSQYDKATLNLFNVESKISELLNRDSLNNDFRVKISSAFTALVAVVIIGFYWLAFRRDEVSKNVFSGEKGIQFITLFLIVIAIILFGIMGTLESRELSALLGALAGYILGKTSVQRDESA